MHTKRLEISPAWIFRTNNGELFEPVLFSLLENLRDTGKLTAAADAAGISYRHAWNLLNRSSEFFGLPLVQMSKGRGTTLSMLGETFLWADQRLKASLGPQIDSMASEFNDQIQQLIASAHPVLRLHASHGYAVSLLPELSDKLRINLQYRNPKEALSALNRGDCDIASFHIPTEPALAKQIFCHYQDYLNERDHRFIRLVIRSEGLMMRKGAGHEIRTLHDLCASELRFIGRDFHSGTRILFNLLLNQQGLVETDINRTSQQEFTHTAVAAYVASGMADVGFGVRAAAAQFDLDFIELSREHYVLLYRAGLLHQNTLEHLTTMLRSERFLDSLREVPGYEPDFPGEIVTIDELIPHTI